MSSAITVARNHFYKKVLPTSDGILNSAYGDLSAGSGTTALIKTGPDYTVFLAGTSAPAPPEYGAGELSELWTEFYVNSFSTDNTVLPPMIKGYVLDDTVTVTEGGQLANPNVNYTLSGTRIDAFCSYLDYMQPWLEENFDGVNKGYGDRDIYEKQVQVVNKIGHSITNKQWRDLIKKQGKGKLVSWYTVDKILTGGGQMGGNPGYQQAEDRVLQIELQTDGTNAGKWKLQYPDDWYMSEGHDMWWGKGGLDEDKYTVFPLATWIAGGAISQSVGSVKTYNQFDTEFTDTVTQFNSIFNFVKECRDIEDIKVQTVGTSGDDQKFYTYSRIVLDSKDYETGTQSCHFMNFWENYTILYSNYKISEEGTYPMAFGFSNTYSTPRTPMPQYCVASMDHLPVPIPLDIAALSGARLGLLSHSTTSPYIEISLKVEKLPATLKTVDSAGGGTSDPKLTFDRGFFIIFGNEAPTPDENFNAYLNKLRATEDTAGKGWYGLWFWYQSEGDDNVKVVSINSNVGGGAPIMTSASDSVKLHSTFSQFSEFDSAECCTIPVNSWETMRIKQQSQGTTEANSDGSGGSTCSKILVYFPSEYESDGTMKTIKIDMKDSPEGNDSDIWNIKSMSMWCNNFRAVYQDGATSGGGTTNNSMNYNLSADETGFNSQDKYASVLVDGIKFFGYNNTIENASVNKNNQHRLLSIPSAPICPPCSGDAWGTDFNEEGDNYFLGNNALTQVNLCFGADGRYYEAGGYQTPYDNTYQTFLMNNFTAVDEFSIRGIPSSMGKINLGSSGSSDMVGDVKTWGDLYNLGDFNGGVTAEKAFVNGAPFFIDNFKQKGYFSVSGLTTLAKRENPYVAARILTIDEGGTQITVDNPQIFDLPLGNPKNGGTEYCVWSLGPEGWDDATQLSNTLKEANDGTGSCGFGFGHGLSPAPSFPGNVPLFQIEKRSASTITLNRSILVDDENLQSLATTDISGTQQGTDYQNKANINQIMIGPKKYWFNIILMNATGSIASTNDFGETYLPFTGNTYLQEQLPSVTYGPVLLLDTTGSLGTTYNEYLCTDGANLNSWSVIPDSEGIVKVNTDYGFGVYQAGEGGTNWGGFINKTALVSGNNFLNLSQYVKKESPEFSDVFNLGIYPNAQTMGMEQSYKIDINTKDAASNKFTLVWGLYDQRPANPTLTVTSLVDYVGTQQTGRPGSTSDIDIYDATKGALSNALSFKWDEGDKDMWYRLLFIDVDLITNKYHKINFWAPLNEDSSTHTFYNTSKDTTGTAFVGTVAQDIEGFQGYGAKFDGSVVLSSSAIVTLGSASEFTFMAHSNPTTATGTIFHASASAETEALKVWLSGNKIRARVNNAASLTSVTSYECDGVQPLAISLTYNKNLLDNNIKLFVNGRLEDTADYTTDFIASGTVGIGAKWKGSDYMTGFIEEITFHTKCAQLPTEAGSFVYDYSILPDTTGSQSYSYQGKLFLMDFHNIRGKSSADVTESNLAGWKATGLT